MFAALQIPLTDIRSFLHEKTGRLELPTWPIPQIGREFVRNFGVVKRRNRGGIEEWPGEEVFCSASNAVRFARHVEPDAQLTPPTTIRLHGCAFRRIFADDRAVVRIELGFRVSGVTHQVHALDVAQRIMGQSVAVGDGQEKPVPLYGAGQKLSALYLNSSTRKSFSRQDLPHWWVREGIPLLFLEYRRDREYPKFPPHAHRVDSPELEKANIALWHCRCKVFGKDVAFWITLIEPQANRAMLRQLRLNLFRLHAEREAIKVVFSHITQHRIDVRRASDETERLQWFLLNAIRILRKQTHEGAPQSVLFDVAQRADDLVNTGERTTLLSRLDPIRRNLLNSITAFTEPRANTVYIMNYQHQENNGTFHGDVNQIAADTINESFKKVTNSSVDDDLKKQLSVLAKSVEALLKTLPEAKQSEVARDLKTLTDEALSSSPRKQWYELSAQGLIDAAKAVGKLVPEVSSSVAAILAFLYKTTSA